MMAITLGFFKDKKWHFASSEHVLQITKHELGHAIGLPDSTESSDIMHPIVKDYESLQRDSEQNVKSANSVSTDLQSSSQNVQAAGIVTIDWHDRSEKHRKIASEKIHLLAPKIDEAQSLLNLVSYDTNAANDALGNALTAFGLAKEYLDNAKKMQTDGDSATLQSNYNDSYRDFKSSYDYAKKAEQKLAQITEYVEKANSLA